jgi:hypothetical protein
MPIIPNIHAWWNEYKYDIEEYLCLKCYNDLDAVLVVVQYLRCFYLKGYTEEDLNYLQNVLWAIVDSIDYGEKSTSSRCTIDI